MPTRAPAITVAGYTHVAVMVDDFGTPVRAAFVRDAAGNVELTDVDPA